MIITEPHFAIIDEFDGEELLAKIEKAARTCYKSDQKAAKISKYEFLKKIIFSGHESVLEHEKISVRVICDRGVSHEIVRHRIASYSQESTRYCNYSSDRFNNEICVIKPFFWNEDPEKFELWKIAMENAEYAYLKLVEMGATAQEARSVLPNSLKTELVMTMNMREWRHFFRLRTSEAAHPQMREIACPMLDTFKKKIPVLFDDI